MEENLSALPRRRFLMLSAASSMAGLLSLLTAGCGSGSGTAPFVGSAGQSTVNGSLTVTPTRVAPGNSVTIGNIASIGPVPDGGTFKVLFGDQPAAVRGMTADGTGLNVIAPPFFDLRATGDALFVHHPPTGPVPITIQVLDANGTPVTARVTAQSTVRVDALPPAPGAAVATVGTFRAAVDLLSSVFTEGLLSIADDVDPGNTDPTLRYSAAQGAGLLAGLQSLLNGSDNANSLAAILSGTAPIAGGKAMSPNLAALTDAMAAQSGTAQRMVGLMNDIADIVQQVAPEALISRGAHLTRSTGGDIVSGIIDITFPVIPAIRIAWNSMTPVTRYITSMYIQRKLAAFTNSQGLAVAELVIAIAAPAISAASATALALGPGAVPAEALIGILDTALYAEGIASKLLSFVSTLMPANVADFYVLVNNKNRVEKSVPIEIPLGKVTPLKVLFAPESTGGQSLTVADYIQLVVDTAFKIYFKSLPKEKGLIDHREIIVNYLVGALGGIFTFVFKQVTGSPPPRDFSLRTGVNLKPQKYAAVDINDDKFAAVTTFSTQFLFAGRDPKNARAYILIGKKVTTADNQAGFRATLQEFRPNPLFPSLVEIAGSKSQVLGIVRVKGLDANPSIR